MKGKNCLISLNILHFSPNLQSDEGLQKFQTNNMIAKKIFILGGNNNWPQVLWVWWDLSSWPRSVESWGGKTLINWKPTLKIFLFNICSSFFLLQIGVFVLDRQLGTNFFSLFSPFFRVFQSVCTLFVLCCRVGSQLIISRNDQLGTNFFSLFSQIGVFVLDEREMEKFFDAWLVLWTKYQVQYKSYKPYIN